MSLTTTTHTTTFTAPHLSTPSATFYKIITSSHPKHPSALPLLIIHGGPLLGHNYTLTLSALAHHTHISSLIFYDHIGCGLSSRIPPDSVQTFADNFWTINLAQLQHLISHLQSSSSSDPDAFSAFYVLGHSLGSMLATLYAASNPVGLKALVLANTLTNIDDMTRGNLELFREFPPKIGRAIVEVEEVARGTRQSTDVGFDEYMRAAEVVRRKHFNRRETPSEGVGESMRNIWEVMDVFEVIVGARIQFLWGGPLASLDTKPLLPKISVPTLIIKGKFDQARPWAQKPFFDLMREKVEVELGGKNARASGVREVCFEGASHMVTDECPEKVVEVVGGFVDGLWEAVEGGR